MKRFISIILTVFLVYISTISVMARAGYKGKYVVTYSYGLVL